MKQARRKSNKASQGAAVYLVHQMQKRQVQGTRTSRTSEGCFSAFLFNPAQEPI